MNIVTGIRNDRYTTVRKRRHHVCYPTSLHAVLPTHEKDRAKDTRPLIPVRLMRLAQRRKDDSRIEAGPKATASSFKGHAPMSGPMSTRQRIRSRRFRSEMGSAIYVAKQIPSMRLQDRIQATLRRPPGSRLSLADARPIERRYGLLATVRSHWQVLRLTPQST